MKVLNLYAGIGGNRKLWPEECEVTAVEIDSEIARIYQDHFPKDKVIVGDAHEYLVKNYENFDFIWSSPPCPTHSQFRHRCGVKAWDYEPIYPDMKLYEEIIFLKHHAECKWVVENVESYYTPLIIPMEVSRHFFWGNFFINPKGGFQQTKIKASEIKDLEKMHGYDLSRYKVDDKRKILRNCVEPELGLHVFNCAFKEKQTELCVILDGVGKTFVETNNE